MWKIVAALVLLGALALMLLRPEAVTGGRSDPGDRRNSESSESMDAPVSSAAPEPKDAEEVIAPERVRVAIHGSGKFHGRVVASEDALPIAGAQVFAGDDALQSHRKPIVTTDPAGEFDVPMDRYLKQLLTVTAEGRGPALFSVDDQHDSPDKRSTITLHPEAVLSGWIRNRSRSQDPLRVFLAVDTQQLRPPSWNYKLGKLPVWVGEVMPDESFRMDGLPPDVLLQVTVRAGQEQLLSLPTSMGLQPGEHRQVEWQIGSGAILSGLAGNAADGQPENDLEIWLAPGAETHGFYFQPWERDVRKTRSDWQGRFKFHGLDPGEWAVGPAPEGSTRDAPSGPKAAAPAVTRVEIPDETSDGEVVVRVHRGHYISGRVIDPEGEPAPNEPVAASARESGGYLSCQSDEEGLFRLGPLVPATFSLVAGWTSRRFAKSDRVEAWSGQTDVILRLKRAASISGTVIDALTGDPAPGWICLQGVEPLGYSGRNTERDGSFELTAVEPGLHHLIAKSEAGRIGFLKDLVVRSGESVADLELLVRAGGTVRVGYKGPLEWANYRAISDGVSIGLDGLQNGTEATFVAPAGPLEVQLIGSDRKSGTLPPPILFERSRNVHVRFGETTTVTFEIEE